MCVFNRGLLVIDVPAWKQRRLAEATLCFVNEYARSGGRLWRFGVSQPPLLLAVGISHRGLNGGGMT